MRILVGLDGSGPSRAALTWALKRARELSVELVLVHVVDDEWGQVGTDYADTETTTGRALLSDALKLGAETAPHLTITTELYHGSPAWELVAAARDDDMIVVGTHKTGYLHGRSLGTKSIVVASIAPCSVVVVPEETSSGRTGVVVGVAPGEFWHDAVLAGTREAARLGQSLSLVHVSPTRDDDSSVEILTQGRGLLAAAAALAVETVPGIAVRSRLSRRRPAEALLDASHASALLVLGVSRHSPANAGFIGSVTHDVLLNINSTVLIARLPSAEHPGPLPLH